MNFSVEAEGIDFILRFRDEASDQINTAEKSYQRLVSAMQSLVQAQRAFTDSTVESMDVAAKSFANNQSGLVTPLTINPEQVALMGQFEQRATLWFRDMVNQMLGYINRVRTGTAQTAKLRREIHGLVEDLTNLNKTSASLAPMFEQFKSFRLPAMDLKVFQQIARNLNKILKSIERWIKLQPDFSKATKGYTADTTAFGASLTAVQTQAQTGAFHISDLERNARKLRNEVEKGNPKLKEMGNLLSHIANLKYAVGGIMAGLLLGQGVQKFAALEDSVLGLANKLGLSTKQMYSTIDAVRNLSRQNGLSADEIGGSLSVIAEKAGKLDDKMYGLSVKVVEFARITKTSAITTADSLGDLIKAYDLTTESAQHLLQMANRARIGSRGLMGPEFLDMFKNVEQLRRLSQNIGFKDPSELIKANAASLMAMQKHMSVISNQSGQIMQKFMTGMEGFVGDQATDLRKMIGDLDMNYDTLVAKFRKGEAAEAFIDVVQTFLKKTNGMQGQELAIMQKQFEQVFNMTAGEMETLRSKFNAGQLRAYVKDLRDRQKINQTWDEQVERFKNSISGIMEKVSSMMTFLQTDIIPVLEKYVIPPIAGLIKFMNVAIDRAPILGKALSGLILGLEVLVAGQGIRTLMKLLGMGGVWGSIKNLMGLGGAASSGAAGAAAATAMTSNTATTAANTAAVAANTAALSAQTAGGFLGKAKPGTPEAVEALRRALAAGKGGVAFGEAASATLRESVKGMGFLAAFKLVAKTFVGDIAAALPGLALPLASVLTGAVIASWELNKKLEDQRKRAGLDKLPEKLAEDLLKIADMNRQDLTKYEKKEFGVLKKGAEFGAFSPSQVDAFQEAIEQRKRELDMMEFRDSMKSFPKLDIEVPTKTPSDEEVQKIFPKIPLTVLRPSETPVNLEKDNPEVPAPTPYNSNGFDEVWAPSKPAKPVDFDGVWGPSTPVKPVEFTPRELPEPVVKPAAYRPEEDREDLSEVLERVQSSGNPDVVRELRKIATLLERGLNKKERTPLTPKFPQLQYGNV